MKKIRKWLSIALIPIGIAALIAGQNLGRIDFTCVWPCRGSENIPRETLVFWEEKPETGKSPASTTSVVKQRMLLFASWLLEYAEVIIVVIGVIWLLAKYWLPLGAAKS